MEFLDPAMPPVTPGNALPHRPRSPLRTLLLSVAVACTSLYLALLVAEIGLWWHARPMERLPESRGMWQPDKTLGVVLTPGYDARFDDGIARGRTKINSLGDRDDEPGPDASHRVLLVGDSFAFGALLDQSQTIDKWMERLKPGIDAYNLGVIGYDLPNQLDAMRRTRVAARHVVYAYFGNDLEPPSNDTVVAGYRVRRIDAEGGNHTDAERIAKIRAVVRAHRKWRMPPLDSLLLVQVRGLVRASLRRAQDPATPIEPFPQAKREEYVARGVSYTLQMRDDARQHGMSFQVAILPAVEEVRAGRYTRADAQYVAALRAAGLAPVEMLSRLTPQDYWAHNLHFNPQGAKVAAQVIDDALPDALNTK